MVQDVLQAEQPLALKSIRWLRQATQLPTHISAAEVPLPDGRIGAMPACLTLRVRPAGSDEVNLIGQWFASRDRNTDVMANDLEPPKRNCPPLVSDLLRSASLAGGTFSSPSAPAALPGLPCLRCPR